MTECKLILLLARHKTGDTRQIAGTLPIKDTALMPEDSLIPDRVTRLKTRLPMAVPHQ
jgi:hypothetical protein